jgi:RNA polymerase sigma-70 factor (ECF subfamily)
MVNKDPDIDLLPGLRLGQDEALSRLMDRHLKTVMAIGYYMLGDAALAEDVAQSTFLKLWQVAPNWKTGNATLLTWMRRVATNDCLDRLRKKQPIYTDSVPERIDEGLNALEIVQAENRAAYVKKALRNLPDKQRAAITLSYYQGVSQKEGAEILGVGEKAYESLLSRGRKNLKTSLSPLVEGELI